MTQKALQDAGTPTAMDDATATRLGLKTYLHGGSYVSGLAPTITANAGGGASISGVFIPYQMQNGSWRLKMNFVFSSNSNTNQDCTVVGLVFEPDHAIAVSGYGQSTTFTFLPGTNNSFIIRFAAAATGARVSGDVGLQAKPTWAY